MRSCLRLLRRQRRAISRSRTDQDRSPQELCHLPAARRRARGDAVEFSILAGFPVCRAGADSRLRYAAVMKHSSNVPGCALAIGRVFQDAAFPKDLFRTLMISNAQVYALRQN